MHDLRRMTVTLRPISKLFPISMNSLIIYYFHEFSNIGWYFILKIIVCFHFLETQYSQRHSFRIMILFIRTDSLSTHWDGCVRSLLYILFLFSNILALIFSSSLITAFIFMTLITQITKSADNKISQQIHSLLCPH